MAFKFDASNLNKTRQALATMSNPSFQPKGFPSNSTQFNGSNGRKGKFPDAKKTTLSSPPLFNESQKPKTVSSMITSPIIGSDRIFTSSEFIHPQKFVMTEYVQKFIAKFETHGSIDPFAKKPDFDDLCLILYTPAASKHELSLANAQLVCSDIDSLNLHSMHVIDGTKLYSMAANVQYLNAGVIYLPKSHWDAFTSKTHAHVKMEMNFACSPVHLNKLRLAHWMSPFLLTKMSVSFQLQVEIYDHFEQFVKNTHANVDSPMRVFGSKNGKECGSLEPEEDLDSPLDFSKNNVCLIDVNDDFTSAERKMHVNLNVFRNAITFVKKEFGRANGGNSLVQKMRASKVFLLYFDLNNTSETRNRKQRDPSVVNTDTLKAFDGFNTVFVIVDSEGMIASSVSMSSVEAVLMSLKQVSLVDYHLNYCSDVLMNDGHVYSLMLSCICKTLSFGGRILISSWIHALFEGEKKTATETFEELKKLKGVEDKKPDAMTARKPTTDENEDENEAAKTAFDNHLDKVEKILSEDSEKQDATQNDTDEKLTQTTGAPDPIETTFPDAQTQPNQTPKTESADQNSINTQDSQKDQSKDNRTRSHSLPDQDSADDPTKESDASSSATFDSATEFKEAANANVLVDLQDIFSNASSQTAQSSTTSSTKSNGDQTTSKTTASKQTDSRSAFLDIQEQQLPAPPNSLDDGISASMGLPPPKIMTVDEVEAALFGTKENANVTSPVAKNVPSHEKASPKNTNGRTLPPVPEEVPIGNVSGTRQLKVSFDDLMDFSQNASAVQNSCASSNTLPSTNEPSETTKQQSSSYGSSNNSSSSTSHVGDNTKTEPLPTTPSPSDAASTKSVDNDALSTPPNGNVDDHQAKSNPSSVFDFTASCQSSKSDSGLCTPTASTTSDPNQALFYQQFSFIKEYNCTPENLRLLLETVRARLIPMHLVHPEVVPNLDSVCEPRNLSLAFGLSTLCYDPNPNTGC